MLLFYLFLIKKRLINNFVQRNLSGLSNFYINNNLLNSFTIKIYIYILKLK